MSADRIYLQQSAKTIDESPAFLPIGKVKIVVGENSDGVPIVHEAGEEAGWRTLEIHNPWGTQQIANDILAKVGGYAYKPYRAEGAIMNPVAELGDAVNIGEVYSVLADVETTFSPIMSSNIGAPDDSAIEHEYPYEPSENREISRKIAGATASLTVKIGEIEGSLSDYLLKTDLYDADGNAKFVSTSAINSVIGNYIDSDTGIGEIIGRLSGIYQTIIAADEAYQSKGTLNAAVDAEISAYINTTDGLGTITTALNSVYQTKPEEGESFVVNTELSNSITQYVNTDTGKNEIVQAVKSNFVESSYQSTITQTANSISWLVSGTGEPGSQYAVTSDAITSISNQINLTGYVTFNSLMNPESTNIDGSNITSGKISAKYIDVDEITLHKLYGTYYDSDQQAYLNQVAIDIPQGSQYIKIGGYGVLSADYQYIECHASNSVTFSDRSNAGVQTLKIDIRSKKVLGGAGTSRDWELGDDTLYWKNVTSAKYTLATGNYSASFTLGYYAGVYTIVPSAEIKLGNTNNSFGMITAKGITVPLNGITVSSGGLSVIGATYLAAGKNATLGFFESAGGYGKQTLSTTSANMSYTKATSDNYLTILNNLCGILANRYNLIDA